MDNLKYLLFMSLFSLTNCFQAGGNRVVLTNKKEANFSTLSPFFTHDDTYIDNGSSQFTQTFPWQKNQVSTVKIRGPSIHRFLQNETNRSQKLCLIASFPQSLILLSLTPRKEIDLEKETMEHYYLIQSIQEEKNRQQCSESVLINALKTRFPSHKVSYHIQDACLDCTSNLISDDLLVYDNSSGEDVSHIIDLKHLRLQPLPLSQLSLRVPSCRNDSQCKSIKNYDCCLQRQCVKDRAIKYGVDLTSQAFLQSRQNISQDPKRISHYPEFYYLCPQASTENSPENSQTSYHPFKENSKDRILRLKQLSQCTTPEENEEGLCTISYPHASTQILQGIPFHTLKDARDFSHTWSGPSSFSQDYASQGTITKITYGGKVLYDKNHYRCMRSGFECFSGNSCTNESTLCPIKKFPIAGGACRFNPGAGATGVATNDNLKDTQCVVIDPSFAATPSLQEKRDDLLDITYRVNASCVSVNSLLAKCQKYYVQGQFDQSNMASDDHSPHSKTFYIPSLADTSKLLQVFVDGLQTIEGINWNHKDRIITFQTPVFDGQRVRIEYYVDISKKSDLLTSRNIAQEEINDICGTKNGLNATLSPVREERDGEEKIVDYTCLYPQKPLPDPPPEQVAILDNKSIPVRYYDINGTNHDHIDHDTPKQEGRVFLYQDGNRLKPNNLESHVGFHEIYGSVNNNRYNSPKPPLKINVKPGKLYNIYVESGQYSSCFQCGRDYYSALNRLFPDAYGKPGDGLRPDPFKTERIRSSLHETHLRSDDLLFGRACFLPASMIPWTHRPHRKKRHQRRQRQEAQHFFFANGYQKDWYGFDYGSIIGSFNGSHWFSVGNKRQIRAKSHKLYLAINSYFADLSPNNSYSIRVSEVNHLHSFHSSFFVEDIAKSDTESDGTQCRQYHQCDTDRDCITQLGWDYACETIDKIKSIWPIFNDNAQELSDSGRIINLAQLTDSQTSGSHLKRCIYRGKGSLCHPNYHSQTNSNSYAGYSSPRVNGCSANNWCAKISSEQVFNQKIARFAASPEHQESSAQLPRELNYHSFGLGARVLGRPFNYHGTKITPPLLQRNFSRNQVEGICIPGRDPTVTSSYEAQHAANPRGTNKPYDGDMVGNIGMTLQENSASINYYNSCPVIDEKGQLYQYENPGASLTQTNEKLGRLSSQQNLTTNLLKTISHSDIQSLLSPFTTATVDKLTLQESRCLRSGGSACFTDLDCSPSFFGEALFQGLDPETDASTLGINGYEIKYWQEPLICSQRSEKYSFNYDLKKNVCCRDKGLTLTIGSDDPNSSFGPINNRQIAGYNDPTAGGIDLDNPTRYTRSNIIFKESHEDNTLYPSLQVSTHDNVNATPHPLGQYQTFATIAERTCCTGHWVREFHENNGGGHKWTPKRMQTLNKSNLACLNYDIPSSSSVSIEECIEGSDNCDCTRPDEANCFARAIPLRDGERYNKFFSSLELTGIPQILIQTHAPKYEDDGLAITCHAPTKNSLKGSPIPGTLNPLDNGIDKAEYREYDEDGNPTHYYYYKASDENNFSENIKQVFSPDKVSCCLPPGSFISRDNPETNCCGSYVTEVEVKGSSEKERFCCLPNYTNLTVFFNRYISSMLKDLPPRHFDPFTGRPRYPGDIIRVAQKNNVCCSGKVAMGKAFSEQLIPGAGDEYNISVKRFIQSNNDNREEAANLYDAGQKWSTDVYCVP